MRAYALVLTIAVSLCAAPAAFAQATGGVDGSIPTPAAPAVPAPVVNGGVAYGVPNPATTQVVDLPAATILPNGYAAAPAAAPQEVKDALAAANTIIGKPYVYGGGHNAKFSGKGYDCSGTVSYALHGGGLLTSPLDSGSFMKWGLKGPGAWITVYTNPGHAFAVIAGLRLDTSAAGDPSGGKGPRWRPVLRSTRGFAARHPDGF
ncbi:NlpC/P60 family protein [Baekduia soli]|uniref:NlpC/P60 family protein n=1 Tax=Baekduia soli TaxID=496014 RepID=A0A5B8UAF8_9ACTN|nr:NlpC/P60 family protein [Baekduia soli]QEC50040.1 NlpC/P60 family protein [Baekduia soli]